MLVLARFRVTMYKISLCCTRVSQNLDFCFCWNRSKFPLAPFLFFFLLSYPRSFLLSTSFLLAGKVWTKSSVNPEKGTLINSRCVGLFMHRFCTKNGACQKAVDIQNAQSFGKIYRRFVSCLSEKLTDVQIDDVTSGSMTTTPNVDFNSERVKGCVYPMVALLFSLFIRSEILSVQCQSKENTRMDSTLPWKCFGKQTGL